MREGWGLIKESSSQLKDMRSGVVCYEKRNVTLLFPKQASSRLALRSLPLLSSPPLLSSFLPYLLTFRLRPAQNPEPQPQLDKTLKKKKTRKELPRSASVIFPLDVCLPRRVK